MVVSDISIEFKVLENLLFIHLKEKIRHKSKNREMREEKRIVERKRERKENLSS